MSITKLNNSDEKISKSDFFSIKQYSTYFKIYWCHITNFFIHWNTFNHHVMSSMYIPVHFHKYNIFSLPKITQSLNHHNPTAFKTTSMIPESLKEHTNLFEENFTTEKGSEKKTQAYTCSTGVGFSMHD